MDKKQNVFGIFIIAFFMAITSILTSEHSLVSTATKASTIALNTLSTFLVKGESTSLKITGTSKKVNQEQDIMSNCLQREIYILEKFKQSQSVIYDSNRNFNVFGGY